MSRELLTESLIGTYDRNKLFLVTFPDGVQKFYPRSTKARNGQISALSWWKKCGFFSEDRDVWAKSVMYPEHAQIMKRAGITPEELFNTLLSPAQVEDILAWFNVYRIVHDRTPKTLNEFTTFVSQIESCVGYRTKNPVTLGKYVVKVRNYRMKFSPFTFAAGNDEWLDTICNQLDSVHNNYFLAPLVKSLMQIGATPEAVDVFVVPGNVTADRYNDQAMEALSLFFGRGEFSPTVETYATMRLLAEALVYAPTSTEFVKELFFSAGTDRQRLRDLIVVEGVTDSLRLNAIFEEEVPTALVGGFL